MSSFRRAVSVLFSPGKTFGELSERPTWIVALVILLVLGGLVSTLVVQKLDTGAQRDLIRQQLEDGGMRGDELERQVDQAASVMERMRPFFPVIGLVFMVLAYLVIALVLWGSSRLAGGEGPFVRAYSTTLHGLMPQAVSALVSLPLLLTTESIDPEVAQRGSLLASSPAFFAPEDASPALLALLSSFDLFTIWSLVLLVIGFGVTAKISRNAAT
ncbi:MAG: YIP1 family protein, partial [Acidobacteriota bacterium]